MQKPDRLEMVTGKDSYRPGQTARVLVKAPFVGRMLFTVEGDRVHEARVLECEETTTEGPMMPGEETTTMPENETTTTEDGGFL